MEKKCGKTNVCPDCGKSEPCRQLHMGFNIYTMQICYFEHENSRCLVCQGKIEKERRYQRIIDNWKRQKIAR